MVFQVYASVSPSLTRGKFLSGLPSAAEIALMIAGPTTQIVGSPTPPQKSIVGTSTDSTLGTWASLSSG